MEDFKVVIFSDGKSPQAIYELLLALELNTKLMRLSRDGKDVNQRLTALDEFTDTKRGILVYESWRTSLDRETHLACTQAIEVGLPLNGGNVTPRRFQMINNACATSGKTGRFITIVTPHDMGHKSMRDVQRTAVEKAVPYQ